VILTPTVLIIGDGVGVQKAVPIVMIKLTGVDFEIWREEFLGSRTTQSADFNHDSKVDGIDFEIWRRNNGNS